MVPYLKDGKTVIPDEASKSVKRNTVALKGMWILFLLYRGFPKVKGASLKIQSTVIDINMVYRTVGNTDWQGSCVS